MKFSEILVENVRRIMIDRNLTQAAMAEFMGTSASQFSKILNGTVKLSIENISNLATNLSLREIDVITYPEIFVQKNQTYEESEPDAILQIKLKKDKKDQVLKLIFGENNINILNK